MPVEKSPGDPVYAGTINRSGALEVEAQKLGRDTTFGRIIEAVERQRNCVLHQKTADRLPAIWCISHWEPRFSPFS